MGAIFTNLYQLIISWIGAISSVFFAHWNDWMRTPKGEKNSSEDTGMLPHIKQRSWPVKRGQLFGRNPSPFSSKFRTPKAVTTDFHGLVFKFQKKNDLLCITWISICVMQSTPFTSFNQVFVWCVDQILTCFGTHVISFSVSNLFPKQTWCNMVQFGAMFKRNGEDHGSQHGPHRPRRIVPGQFVQPGLRPTTQRQQRHKGGAHASPRAKTTGKSWETTRKSGKQPGGLDITMKIFGKKSCAGDLSGEMEVQT